MIKNMVDSLGEEGVFMELDSLYSPKIKVGRYLKPFFKALGEGLIKEGIEESIPLVRERVEGKRGY